MSEDINMDASSAQPMGEAGDISPPRHNTSITDHEFGVRSLASEATYEKPVTSVENVRKGSKEAMAEGIEQQVQEDFSRNSSFDQLRQQLEDTTVNSSEQLGLLPRGTAGKNLSANHSSELNHELVPESVNSYTLADKQEVAISYVQNGLACTGTVEINHVEQSGQPSEDVAKYSNSEQLGPRPEDETESSLELSRLAPEDAAVNIHPGQLTPLPYNVSKNRDLDELELPQDYEANEASTSGGGGRRTSTKSTKGKHALKASVSSTRVLRSRSQEKSKAPEAVSNLPEHSNGTIEETKRKKRKKKQVKETRVDEFSRIRKHLRYLLHRWTYEQNLIDAYSGEGWKGQSLEKIKPEKELQRAKLEIFRCKLKIRDLFQRLDLSISKGRFPASLFDSEGQIDMLHIANTHNFIFPWQIFCAKCESTELPADNDIILCDGACERGFHQLCLEPPLLKDDIPPDDEGWLCPGCDCKVDCIELLNDSQGTNLSILDTWEKVFPEAAAAAAAGNNLDDNLGLPSDDSEDNEYDPDGSEVDEKGEESSSDESDFYTASEDNGTSPKSKQNLELPSDDSEDDEYDPGAPDLDDQVKQESSSSDFTSDSDDFGVVFDNTKSRKGSNGEGPKVGQGKKPSINDELSSLLESGPGHGEAAPVGGRRHVERLDYKKLYDDTYGNVSTDSSDENWVDDADAPKKRRRNMEKGASVSPGGRTPSTQGLNANDAKHNQEVSGHTPKRRARKKIDVEGTNNSPAKRGSTTSSTERSAYRRLGEVVTQGLLKSFKENQFPERATRDNLAKELGITQHQVRKWFENARWSFRHTSRMESKLAESVPSYSTPTKRNQSESGVGKVNAGVTTGNSSTEESNRLRSTTSRGRKRRIQLEMQESDHVLGIEEIRKESASVDLPKAEDLREKGRSPKSQEVRKRGRPKKRYRIPGAPAVPFGHLPKRKNVI
ncbi:hypothetical protein RHSIM_Rhsim11G0155600 [Rhododendron simsii]|uniref:Uncharacterized protein n=1 Tax=Rhododendron simsii TaxID=118357 RepID=A0A834LB61_RHOSS|nr:hypothetical protein RHSIM_Rhsim11G0155600 [Rhododendron simsii]